jgi:hypothetical protein
MQSFETSATVGDNGNVQLTGLPFPSGTQVEVTVRLAEHCAEPAASPTERVGRLFAALDKARNTESVGPLRREELYDRKVLR